MTPDLTPNHKITRISIGINQDKIQCVDRRPCLHKQRWLSTRSGTKVTNKNATSMLNCENPNTVMNYAYRCKKMQQRSAWTRSTTVCRTTITWTNSQFIIPLGKAAVVLLCGINLAQLSQVASRSADRSTQNTIEWRSTL